MYSPGFPDQVDHTLIINGTIQTKQFFSMILTQSGILYDSDYGQPETINFYGPV